MEDKTRRNMIKLKTVTLSLKSKPVLDVARGISLIGLAVTVQMEENLWSREGVEVRCEGWRSVVDCDRRRSL